MRIKLQLKDISKIPSIYYKKQSIEYKIDDFKILAEAQQKNFLEEDYKHMAEDFLWYYDCNLTENEMMENIIEGYDEIERIN